MIYTEDGSMTLRNAMVDECYHSVHGAMAESQFIFIQSGLRQCPKNEISVFEVGFGTGLNAWLAAKEAEETDKKMRYTSIELYPLEAEIYRQLNYVPEDKKADFLKLHDCPWNQPVQVFPNFELRKIDVSLIDWNFDETYDVIFFDAFSPEKQPEMWSEAVFAKLYKAMNSGAILTTYCVKGIVRRRLQAIGFTVERLPGPVGKRQILRAVKP